MSWRKEHLDLVDACNNATTDREHQSALDILQGFRQGLRAAGCADALAAHLADCDLHVLPDLLTTPEGQCRPVCCGVFLDWKPAPVLGRVHPKYLRRGAVIVFDDEPGVFRQLVVPPMNYDHIVWIFATVDLEGKHRKTERKPAESVQRLVS